MPHCAVHARQVWVQRTMPLLSALTPLRTGTGPRQDETAELRS